MARQYSGTLGKVGNCQIGVGVHARLRGGLPVVLAAVPACRLGRSRRPGPQAGLPDPRRRVPPSRVTARPGDARRAQGTSRRCRRRAGRSRAGQVAGRVHDEDPSGMRAGPGAVAAAGHRRAAG
ncbi:hypothetical protein ACH4TP_05630 [Streptomyces sp. NPDC021012]|uniref:hypothetical protein n=1 Tax=Streptomyces sp. NPDC021012 TaxID=3365107 RepID=UPI00379BB88D